MSGSSHGGRLGPRRLVSGAQSVDPSSQVSKSSALVGASGGRSCRPVTAVTRQLCPTGPSSRPPPGDSVRGPPGCGGDRTIVAPGSTGYAGETGKRAAGLVGRGGGVRRLGPADELASTDLLYGARPMRYDHPRLDRPTLGTGRQTSNDMIQRAEDQSCAASAQIASQCPLVPTGAVECFSAKWLYRPVLAAIPHQLCASSR